MPLQHVLRTNPHFFPSVTGPGNQVFHIARRLEARGVRSPVVTTYMLAPAPGSPSHEWYQGVEVTRLETTRGIMAYRWMRGEDRIVTGEPQILHAHSYRNRLTTLVHREARRRGLPYVLQPHGTLLMYAHTLPRLLRAPYVVYDLATRKREVLDADAVVVATRQEGDEAARFGVRADRIHVIPVGVAPAEPVPPRDADVRRAPRVLFVGRIAPDRRVELVIEAAAELRRRSIPFELRIVGPVGLRSVLHRGQAYMDRLQARARPLGGQVVFTGARHGDELAREYREADVFVYTSSYENFGQSVLEAAGHGLPVVATPTGVAADIVEEGRTGHLVPFNDPAELANRLAALLQDPARLAAMGRAMQARVQAEYQWEGIIDRYVALYESLLV